MASPSYILGAILLSAALSATELRLLDFPARPGALTQLRLTLSEPLAIANGAFTVDLDPQHFGDIVNITVFSAAGDVAGVVERNGRRASVRFTSPSGGVGRLPGLPVATIHVPVLSPDASATVTIGTTPWQSIRQQPFPLTVQPGKALPPAEIGIEDILFADPFRILGSGFTADTAIHIPGVNVTSTTFVSPSEMRFTVAGDTTLAGLPVRLAKPNGAAANFFFSLPGNGYIFPTRRLSAFSWQNVISATRGDRGIALLNPHNEPVDVRVEAYIGTNTRSLTAATPAITLPPGAAFSARRLNDIGIQSGGFAGFIASRPIQAIGLGFDISPGPVPGNFWWAAEPTIPYLPFSFPDVLFSPSVTALDYRHQTGTPPPARQSVNYSATVNVVPQVQFEHTVTTASGGAWLVVSRPNPAGNALLVDVNPANLPPGTYSGAITVQPNRPGAKATVTPVSLEVSDRPLLLLSPQRIQIEHTPTPSPQSQNLCIDVKSTSTPINYQVSARLPAGPAWLSTAETSGTTPGNACRPILTGGLAPGTYSATIIVSAPGLLEQVPVTLTIRPPEPVRSLAPSVLHFAHHPAAPAPEPKRVTVSSSGVWTLAIESEGGWLSATPSSGEFLVRVNPASLPPGTHNGKVIVSSLVPRNQIVLPVSLSIVSTATSRLAVSPPELRISGTTAGAQPLAVATGSDSRPLSWSWNPAPGPCPVAVFPVPPQSETPSRTPALLNISCNGVLDYEGTLTFRSGEESVAVPVSMHLDPLPYANAATPPSLASVVNAASGLPGPVAPGQALSLHGIGMQAPISFDGVAATPFYSSLFQTNVVVPDSIKGNTQLQIGTVSLPLPVAPAAPGLFTLSATGVGPGAVLNEDHSINTPDNPAPRDSIIQIFGTGGAVPPQPAEAAIGTTAAEVLYSGSTGGLWQVNVRVPANATPGPAIPVIIRTGGAASQPGVTIAVR